VIRLLSCLAACLVAANMFAGAPEWALQAARTATPADVGDAPAVVLSNEVTLEVDARGSTVRTLRYVLRALTAEGRSKAACGAAYVQGTSKVQSSSAWLIRAGRSVKSSERDNWADVSNDSFGALYSDSRMRVLSFANEAAVGDVFACEVRVTEPLLFAEEINSWSRDGLPVVHDSYRVELPPGFSAVTVLKGEPSPVRTQSADGRITTWTLENQPYLPAEPNAPRFLAISPMLLLRVEPRAGTSQFRPIVLRTWHDLANWAQTMNEVQCDRSPDLTATAQRLTAGMSDDLDKIRALGSHVQGLHYVAVFEGLGKGLGFQPHKASQVLSQGYGDCKDKSNLLRALLREVGIEAYLAVARVDAEIGIEPNFPSAAQFNHAIVAIRVAPEVKLPAVADTPKGRFLFFDPTAEHTVVGDLPAALQGTPVFVQQAGNDGLLSLPRIPPEQGHALVRRAHLALTSEGKISGHLSIECEGQAAAGLRHAFSIATEKDPANALARTQLGDVARAARLTGVGHEDNLATGTSRLSFDLEKENYFPVQRNSVAIVRTDVFARGALPTLAAHPRRLPVMLMAIAFDDEAEFALPKEMRAEELPSRVALTSPYGHYLREITATEGKLRLVRKLTLESQVVAPANTAALRKFLLDVSNADHASVVLHVNRDEDSGL